MTAPASTALVLPEPMSVSGVSEEHYKLLGEFRDDMERNLPLIMASMPTGVRAETLVATALLAAQDNIDLLKCEPSSLLRAVLKTAVLGLAIGRTCDIVPTKKGALKLAECWIRVKGVADLAMRAGAIRWVKPGFVCEGDPFTYRETESGTKFEHDPIGTPLHNASNITHVYARVYLPDRQLITEVWPLARVFAHRDKYAKGLDNSNSPWKTQLLGMCAKTVVGAALKYARLSAELSAAINEGSEVEGSYEVVNDPTAALQAANKALNALSAGPDKDGVVSDPSDGLTLETARMVRLPGNAQNFDGHGGQTLAECGDYIVTFCTWVEEKATRRKKYAREYAAAQMVFGSPQVDDDDALG